LPLRRTVRELIWWVLAESNCFIYRVEIVSYHYIKDPIYDVSKQLVKMFYR